MAATHTVPPGRSASSNPTRTIQIRPQPVLRLTAPSGVLRLSAEPSEQRHIQWAEDVVDNEGLGKKSSKVCCIYHKPRAADESSDGESTDDSSSSSDSGSEPDNSMARPSKKTSGGRGRHSHNHGHGDDCGEGSSSGKKRRQKRQPSPNAYEKIPKGKRQ